MRRVRGLALTALGSPKEGKDELVAAIVDARERGADHDLVLALAAMSRWHQVMRSPVPTAISREQVAIERRLGILALPGSTIELPTQRVRSSADHPAGQEA